jgi:hypothetical protein|tara:strand:+ start:106 stop:693 length:588 start_codon:yes stop_codon:yes gene_type:complete
MDEGKKKIIFLDESAEESSSAIEGGSQFQETSQFPDVSSDNYEISNSSNTVLNSNITTTSEVPVEHTGGNDNLSEASDSPDLTSLNVKPDVSNLSSDVSDNGSEYDGGDLISEGGASSVSDISSVRTNDLLSVDPLYIRLTKFLEADIKLDGGGSKKVNVVDVLHDISTSLKDITKSLGELSSYSQKIAVEKMKQ